MTKAEVIARICGESRLNGATIYDHRADLNIGVDTRGDLSFDDAVAVPFSLLREAVRELVAREKAVRDEYEISCRAIRSFGGKDVESRVDAAVERHLNGGDWSEEP